MNRPIEWTLSGFADEISPDPEVQLAVMAALGARHIDVRGAWGTNVLDLTDAQAGDLRTQLDDRGFAVSCLASPIGKVDVSLPIEHEVTRLRRAIELCRTLGTRYIRIFSFYRAGGIAADAIRDDVIARLAALTEVAEAEDVVLVHENEKEIYGDVPERVLDIVHSVPSEHLRLVWDAANFVQVGVEPFARAWPALSMHVDYVHVKDALLADGSVVPAGEGDGQVPETIAALRDSGYAGVVSLEPHLVLGEAMGGFSGPSEFGRAARAFRALCDDAGVSLR